jgi:anti-sigma factor RsiW
MKPVEPEELSAFLDGELDPERSREIEMQIESDPVLRAEFDELARTDVLWRAAAATAAFEPRVHLPMAANRWAWLAGFPALIGALLVLRMLPKFIEAPAFGFSLQAVALAVLLAGIIWFGATGEREVARSSV